VSRYIAKDNSRFDIPISMDMELKEIEVGETYNLDDVYFATNSTDLTENSKKVIEGFYDFLNDNPSIVIEIQGHTDNVGTDSYNMKLSQGRAKSVYDELKKYGISDNQMSYKGYGETKPISENRTKEGRALNRRTVFLIIKK
jgi:outer membrane protein OmpA-like peptidoglycan-associated protein